MIASERKESGPTRDYEVSGSGLGKADFCWYLVLKRKEMQTMTSFKWEEVVVEGRFEKENDP